MKLSERTKQKLLSIKEAGLKKADLAKLENCLSAIRSQEDMVAAGDYVSCRSKLSEIASLLEKIPHEDVRRIEERIKQSIFQSDYRFPEEESDDPEKEVTYESLFSPTRVFSKDFLISSLRELAFSKLGKGKGRPFHPDAQIRRILFAQVCGFFTGTLHRDLNDMTSSNWFNKFMDELTKDPSINKLFPHVTNVGEYIIHGKKISTKTVWR
jgi:hypothetical protein